LACRTVVVVGAGQAGLQVAVSLRQQGFDGRLVMYGAEPHLPYQRPPLSKQVLKGEWPPEKCQLHHREFLESHAIELHMSAPAASLDPGRKLLRLDSGREVEYDKLAICTGSRLNRLHFSGSGLAGVHYLRTLDQSLELRSRLTPGSRLVIAGGGYIGLEVAASARSRGCEVTVIEALDHVMQRSALPPIADFLLERQRREGVEFRLGHRLTEILGHERVQAVVLDDGQLIEADVLLKGIGVRPDLRWLEGSGLETGRGLRVDTRCRTSAPDVYGAGDICESRHALFPGWLVLESVQNAVSQGKIAAANILGREVEYDEVPWFWSEQFDCRFQMAGIPQAGDELVIRETGSNSLTVLSLGADRMHAIQCVNAPRDYMAGRKLIALQDQVPCERLRDPKTQLRELL